MQSALRLTTLRERTQVRSKLMNVAVPDTLEGALHRAVKELGCTKTAAVIALLNEGLDEFAKRRKELVPGRAAPKQKRKRRGRPAKLPAGRYATMDTRNQAGQDSDPAGGLRPAERHG